MSRTEKLLFRWVGKSIEDKPPKQRAFITPYQRQEYLKYLADALDHQKGLFSRTPTDENLGKVISKGKRDGKSIRRFKSELPCLCFTELDLGDCAHHWNQFGRLAFGFTKQFILKQGGSPMQYCLGTSDCDSVHDLACVSDYLKRVATGTEKAEMDAMAAFQRLCHFYKRVRPEVAERKSPTEKPKDYKATEKKKFRPEPSPEDKLAKEAGFGRLSPMRHLEEHEWRLVYSENHDRWHKIKGGRSTAEAWFHVEVGEELQMIILPDNRSLQLVQQSDYLCDRLFRFPKKPVQVLSLEVIARA